MLFMQEQIKAQKLKYFYDTEFVEDGSTIDPISIAIASDDNRKYYALNHECDYSKADQWVWDNVISKLPPKPIKINPAEPTHAIWKTKLQIAEEVQRFLLFDGKEPVLWAYYADYDHVLLAQLYGRMIDLPAEFPMYTKDLKQVIDDLGNPRLTKPSNQHDALVDAQWVKDTYYLLKENYSHPCFIDYDLVNQ